MKRSEYEAKLRALIDHAWDREISWNNVEAWIDNFDGKFLPKDDEELYALFTLTRFMYFGKRMVREMLKSLYRDHFESPLIQRIRRNLNGTKDIQQLRNLFEQELASTRFVGMGNPAESGAHLLYYFRQVNYLPKNLFVDFASAFIPKIDRHTDTIIYDQKDTSVSRYVFFDDLVASGTQASLYLATHLKSIRAIYPKIELRFMSLFATTHGLKKMNAPGAFNGEAMCLFELDETFRAFDATSRYFTNPPDWFDSAKLLDMTKGYGTYLKPGHPLGYKDGQLLLAFSHNTPDNTPPIFWDEGHSANWTPIFIRYDKIY